MTPWYWSCWWFIVTLPTLQSKEIPVMECFGNHVTCHSSKYLVPPSCAGVIHDSNHLLSKGILFLVEISPIVLSWGFFCSTYHPLVSSVMRSKLRIYNEIKLVLLEWEKLKGYPPAQFHTSDFRENLLLVVLAFSLCDLGWLCIHIIFVVTCSFQLPLGTIWNPTINPQSTVMLLL